MYHKRTNIVTYFLLYYKKHMQRIYGNLRKRFVGFTNVPIRKRSGLNLHGIENMSDILYPCVNINHYTFLKQTATHADMQICLQKRGLSCCLWKVKMILYLTGNYRRYLDLEQGNTCWRSNHFLAQVPTSWFHASRLRKSLFNNVRNSHFNDLSHPLKICGMRHRFCLTCYGS
jgi:hypothetical protein